MSEVLHAAGQAVSIAIAVLLVAFTWWRRSQSNPKTTRDATVTLIIPTCNEEKAILPLMQLLSQLQPAVHQVLVADGNSSDRTVSLAEHAGATVVRCKDRGRSRQMNAAAEFATGEILCFVHADSAPPLNLVEIIRGRLAHPAVVLGGFRTIIDGSDGRPLRFMTWHHNVKTYYAPFLAQPLSFCRGFRCLFGDQTLFCRTADFRSVGGYNTELPIMEDCDLCIRLHLAGPISFRSKHPVSVQPLSGAMPPAGTPAAGEVRWVQSHGAQAFLDQRGVSCGQEDISNIASCSSDPLPLRQRHQPTVSAAIADRSQGLVGQSGARVSSALPPASLFTRWLTSLKKWAVSHCRRRGGIAVVWNPVAHTSGRRLEVLGNLKATKIHFTLALAWYLRLVTPQQLVDLYHLLYTDDYR